MTNLIDLPLALAGGLLTVASPCVLPILPIILGSAFEQADRTRPLLIVAGFVTSFSLLGMLLAGASQQVALAHDAVRHIGMGMLALAGLAMMWKAPYASLVHALAKRLERYTPLRTGERAGKAGSLLLGMSLGAVWTPCAGPVLASVLVLVAQARDFGWSATLLLLYACGAGIPMLLIAYGGSFVRKRIRLVARHADRLQQLFGLLIFLTALLIYLQYDVLLYAHLANLVSP